MTRFCRSYHSILFVVDGGNLLHPRVHVLKTANSWLKIAQFNSNISSTRVINSLFCIMGRRISFQDKQVVFFKKKLVILRHKSENDDGCLGGCSPGDEVELFRMNFSPSYEANN